MNTLITRAAPGAGTDSIPDVELAPYALVRSAALPYPAPASATTAFRTALTRLIALRSTLTRLAEPVSDALYRSADQHDPEFHRRVVLPLRRNIHNGRLPRPAQLAALGNLPERIPGLREWLDTAAALAQVREELTSEAPAALTAERATLAETCTAEPLRRAVTMVGRDLLRGIDRVAAAGGHPDHRTRKAEPNALRYALRATAKTSPLSWFTHVGWGVWADIEQPGQTDQSSEQARGYVRINRTLIAGLLHALLSRPEIRHLVPHRIAPALRVADGRVIFSRDTLSRAGGQIFGAREERTELAHSGPLELVLTAVGRAGAAGAIPAQLAATLATHLPGAAERTVPMAHRFVSQLLDQAVLVPIQPANPQDPRLPRTVADWLERIGADDLPEIAAQLRDIDAQTAAFAALPVSQRPTSLEELRQRWQDLFTAVGLEWDDSTPVTEDVAVARPAGLGARHGRRAAAALPELAVLAELFDQYLPVRQLVRDQFVARYGVGGVCSRAADFSVEMAEIWQGVGAVAPDGTVRADSPEQAATLTPQLRELAEARAAVTAAVRAAADPEAEQLWIPPQVLQLATRALPEWVRRRPSSYSFFVQPAASGEGTQLVLNHVYAGWGRFLSRFLDLIAPTARAGVAAQVRRVLGPQARIAQFRPVNGFNANLHPLLFDEEVGEDPAWAGIAADALSLYHDPETDQVRLRVAGDDRPLDVLYLGFLVPFILPERLAHLHMDLGSGLVDFSHLIPVDRRQEVSVRPRLRLRDLVLSRRSWQLPAETVAAWQADLHQDGDVPAVAAAEWAARLGLPTSVFVIPSRQVLPDSTEDYLRYLTQPKPQYVDLTNALHLRTLSKLLGRQDGSVRIEEALPVPGVGNPDGRVVELVAETYRKAVRS